ncbi:hypothetical protein [Lactococcus allomyrinae]|uniref:Uncharacterized protein n=1 Tax=Lactococcus allomyrinae TaxID=2419773 RepID=A0A387BCL7_9LACT|nr:hypothetical protein [Lactococcus allomyrinae]AYG00208.1 hypothetical protein D7I46_03365 [Lactococcus allomyrinae]
METTPKQRYKTQIAPYQSWINSIILPSTLIILYLFTLVGIKINVVGTFIFIFAVITHLNYKRAEVPKICYTAPILYYVYNVVSIPLMILLFISPNEIILSALLSLITIILLILVIVFYYISASVIKKQYPNLKNDFRKANIEYKSSKK